MEPGEPIPRILDTLLNCIRAYRGNAVDRVEVAGGDARSDPRAG